MQKLKSTIVLSALIGLVSSTPVCADQVMMQGFPVRTSPLVQQLNDQIKTTPNSENYQRRAAALRELGLRKEAVDDLNQALSLEPSNASSLILKGKIYFEDGMFPDAVANLDAALKIDANALSALALRSSSYLKMREFDKAVSDANALLQLDANSSYALYLRGAAYEGMKKYPEAITDLSAAIKANPKIDRAFYWRAEAYQNTNEFQKSVDDYSQAIALNPDYRPALLGRAWSYYKLGKFDEALQDCNNAIKFHDANDLLALDKYIGEKATLADIIPDPEYNLGAQIVDDLKNSLSIYNDILKQKPGDREASRDRGMAYMHLSKYKEAIRDFETANKGLPSTPSGYSGIGSEDAYNSAVPEYEAGNKDLTNSNYTSAIAHYQNALKLYPTYGRCWHNLAIACSDLGDYFTAELCCVHAISYRPDDWKLWHTLGVSLFHEYKRDKGDPNKLNAAAAALHQALELNPDTDSDKKDVKTLLASVKSYERALAPVSDFVFTTMPVN